jgi:hypothetical protein
VLWGYRGGKRRWKRERCYNSAEGGFTVAEMITSRHKELSVVERESVLVCAHGRLSRRLVFVDESQISSRRGWTMTAFQAIVGITDLNGISIGAILFDRLSSAVVLIVVEVHSKPRLCLRTVVSTLPLLSLLQFLPSIQAGFPVPLCIQTRLCRFCIDQRTSVRLRTRPVPLRLLRLEKLIVLRDGFPFRRSMAMTSLPTRRRKILSLLPVITV